MTEETENLVLEILKGIQADVLPMNLGGRIHKCLKELGWRQADLLAQVPGLETATLSALIKRDNKWSEHAIEIADALGVHLQWLISGAGPKWLRGEPAQPDTRASPDDVIAETERQKALLRHAKGLTDKQLDEVIQLVQEKEQANREVIEQLAARGKGGG